MSPAASASAISFESRRILGGFLMRDGAREIDAAHDPEKAAGNRPLHAIPVGGFGLRSAAAHERNAGARRRAAPCRSLR